jgi:putative ABC transport system permease protein
VSRAEAEAALARIARAAGTSRPVQDVRLEPVRELVVASARTPLAILAAVVGLTLLLTCANVSAVQLARFTARRHEAAVRLAIGASRARVFAHYLAEGIALALAGAIVGLVLALWGQEIVRAMAPEGFPRIDGVRMSGPVLLFAFVAALAAGLAATVWPAVTVAATRASVVRASGIAGARDPGRARHVLVLAQIVIAMTLLSATGVLVRTMQRLRTVDAGVASLDVMVFDLHRRRDIEGAVEPARFYQTVLERVAALPGVAAATVASSIPFRARDYYGPEWRRRIVSPGYFETLGIPLIAGRPFNGQDREGSDPVAIASERLVREQFGGRNPIGTVFDDVRIVGVVADVRHERLDEPADAAMYLPLAQQEDGRMSMLVRADVPPASLIPTVRGVIRMVDPDQPIGTIATLHQILDRSDAIARRRFHLRILVFVGLFAAVLASLGVYGVAAQTVAQRTPEIGVRVALGATRSDIVTLVLSGTGRLILAGVLFGWLAALGFGRILASALFEVSPHDPLVLSAVTAILVATALLASALPVRRAFRIDPAHSLRRD